MHHLYLFLVFIAGVALSSHSARPPVERPPSAPVANPAVQRQALRVQVREAGLQRISGAHLAHLGASRVHFDPTRLQLHRDGQEVALQLLGAEDGRIDAGDELRFYAPDPGDR